ncbi:MAG: hypothetical protein K2I96_13520 [Lachnospiraceae bacterium]|nr:hypothetical protein [Lachnospiraceae bacterium]
MKINRFIILLLAIPAAVSIIVIIRSQSPAGRDDSQHFFHIEHFTTAVPPKPTTPEESSAQPDSLSPSSSPDETVPADEIFIVDDWVKQIDDFLGKVDAAAQEQELEQEETAAHSIEEENSELRPSRERVSSVIIDTDFASDADDVVAVRLAMCFQDLGMLDVRGIALSTTYSRSPLAVYALCTQDGYGNIPVAMDTSGNGVQVHTNYVDVMYDLPKNRTDYEQPVPMYRRILSASDTRVNIITLGFLQNIQGLMNSTPDQYSPLTGMELIAQKVDTIYIVGGNSTGKPSFNFYWTGEKVISAAKDVARNFPARVVFLQSDLSDDTFCGQLYSTRDSRQRDIVTKALRANDQAGGVVAWDVFSVWCAVQDMNGGTESAFLTLEQGNQYVSDTGATEWTASDTGRHYKMYKHVEGAYYSEIMNNMLLQKYNRTHDTSHNTS